MTDREIEDAALVALLRTRPGKLSWSELALMIMEASSAVDVWEELTGQVLMPEPGSRDPLEAAAEELQRWRAEGSKFTSILRAEYPARLRSIHQAPPALFYIGTLHPDDVGVSVVGSREASPAGLRIAGQVARELVADGITVIAGLALGIDTAAHTAALEAGGRTVAVIGTGINRVYPAQNRELHKVIADQGLLLSQFWPDAPPQKHTFLMRNATMSGYGIATVVVEAGEHSGARAQARMAVEHGRPVILTELVVGRNQWAKDLIGRPGVHVAQGLSGLLETVRAIRETLTPLDDDPIRLIPA